MEMRSIVIGYEVKICKTNCEQKEARKAQQQTTERKQRFGTTIADFRHHNFD